jgi:ABC-type uncharacterized transport system substrate-binding protein
VFTIDPDPVGRGLVASLARPGGNVTGLSDAHADLVPKRLELLKEAAPSAVRVGVLFNPASSLGPAQLKTAQAAAPALGMTVLPVEVRGRGRNDIDRAFETMSKGRFTGILILGDPTIGVHRSRIAELAIKRQLPAVSTLRESAEAGLLMSYGTDFHDLWRRAAREVDKILKGAKPGDLPVEVRGRGRNDIDRAFETMRKKRSTGILILGDPTVGVHRSRIAELAVKSQLPAVSTLRESAEAGLLMSYGTDFHDLWRRAATYVDKILKGAKPGDLPVEQPTKFDLVINLKTAKALGLTIPPSLLQRADQVIE